MVTELFWSSVRISRLHCPGYYLLFSNHWYEMILQCIYYIKVRMMYRTSIKSQHTQLATQLLCLLKTLVAPSSNHACILMNRPKILSKIIMLYTPRRIDPRLSSCRNTFLARLSSIAKTLLGYIKIYWLYWTKTLIPIRRAGLGSCYDWASVTSRSTDESSILFRIQVDWTLISLYLEDR